MNLYSAKEITEVLEKHGFFFKKNLGQNFLIQEKIAARIADASRETIPVEKKALAIEIGPGAGALTRQLCEKFDRVIAIEIDPVLTGVLEETLGDLKNVKIVFMDALKFDFSALEKEFPGYAFAVCSNLPYYITSELIMRVLESGITLESVTVLIQKEAANRLLSAPNSPDYGAITAAVSFYAKAEKLFFVGPGNFIPKPKVDSAVLRLTPHREKPVQPLSLPLFFQVIRASFSARRKTLPNSLYAYFSPRFSKEEILKGIRDAGIDPQRRGETLSLMEYAKISDILYQFEEK